jgi:hypothetical protein
MNSEILWTHSLAVARVAGTPLLALLWGFGALRLLGRLAGQTKAPSLPLSLALGWGLLAHAMWLLAAVGSASGLNWMSPALAWGALGATFLLMGRWEKELVVTVWARVTNAWTSVRWPGVWVAGCVVLLMVAVRKIVCAVSPSIAYDVLEYHLPEVRHLIDTGGFEPMVGNSYSVMPQAVECLYALGRLFEGAGSEYAPKLINVFLGLSAGALVWGLARRLGLAAWLCFLATLVFWVHPLNEVILGDAFSDMGAALFIVAALNCWLGTWGKSGRLDIGMTGVFLGFAFSCKYPVVGIAILPFLIFLAPLTPAKGLPLWLGKQRAGVRAVGAVLLTSLVTGVVYLPWLARAMFYEGSPFPPLTLRWLGESPPLEGALRQFMAEAVRMDLSSLNRYFGALRDRMDEPGALLLVSALLVLVLPGVEKRWRGLGAFVLGGYGVLHLVPNGAMRFLSPLLPVASVLGVLIVPALQQWLRELSVTALLPLAAWTVALTSAQIMELTPGEHLDPKPRLFLKYATGQIPKAEYWEQTLGYAGRMFNRLNASTRLFTKPKVLMLYEARAGALEPRTSTVANTVFDPCIFWETLGRNPQEQPSERLARLRREGFTHLVVNEIEQVRLLGTYPATPAHQDEAFTRARQTASGKNLFDSTLLNYWYYYAPFYYSGENAVRQGREQQLAEFLEWVTQECPPIFFEENDGRVVLVCELQKPSE